MKIDFNLEPYLTKDDELCYLAEDVEKVVHNLTSRVAFIYERFNDLKLHELEQSIKSLYELKNEVGFRKDGGL